MRTVTIAACAFLVFGCGDDSGGGGGGADGPGGDAQLGDGGVPAADGARADAGPPPTCGGLAQDVCEATEGCLPACISMCDCTCPGPPSGGEGCGCEACAPSCFVYDECVATAGFSRCGDAFCDSTRDVCVKTVGGIGITFTCERVPNACLDDRSCECLDGVELCGGAPPAITCEADPEANLVTCECPMCA